MSKRYYWLKLQENFFDREEIKIVENMKNGKEYIIFYMKLLLKSIKTEGKLMFRGVIPYTPEMLSSITNIDIDTVIVATDIFVKLGLMEKWDDGTLFLVETTNMIGSESDSAIRMRKLREKKSQNLIPSHCDSSVQNSDIEIEKDIELDKEKDIDIEKDIEKDKIKISWKEILTAWNSLPSPIKPIRSITKKRKDKIKARINSLRINQEDIIQAIQNIKNSSFCRGKNNRQWIIDFEWLFKDDNNFSKVLEGKYVDKGAKDVGSTGQNIEESNGKWTGFKPQEPNITGEIDTTELI